MHIPDGVLSPATSLVAGATMLPVWAAAGRRAQRDLGTRQVPMLALGAAFCFTIMLFNIPALGGTTAHPVAGTLLAVLLGPWAAVIGISVALAIQALFFGDGGILAYGANCFTMAFVLPFVGYTVYRLIAGSADSRSSRRALAAGIGSFIGLNAAASVVALLLGLQPLLFHEPNGNALYFPFGLKITLPAMLGAHLLIAGPAEAIVTALVVRYLQAAGHALYGCGAMASAVRRGRREALWIGLLALAALSPLGLLASGDAFGEWDANGVREQIRKVEGKDYVPRGLEQATWHGYKGLPALRDYAQPEEGKSNSGYIGAALLGIGTISGLLLLIGRLLKRRGADTPVDHRRSFGFLFWRARLYPGGMNSSIRDSATGPFSSRCRGERGLKSSSLEGDMSSQGGGARHDVPFLAVGADCKAAPEAAILLREPSAQADIERSRAAEFIRTDSSGKLNDPCTGGRGVRSNPLPEWLRQPSAVQVPDPEAIRRRANPYLERTLAALTEGAATALRDERWAREPGLLQRLDPRARLAGLLALIVVDALLRQALLLLALYLLTLLLAAASRLPLPGFVRRVWLSAPLFVGAIVLPQTLNIVTPGRVLLVLLSHPYLAVTAPGLASAGLLMLRVAVAVSLGALLTLTSHWHDLLRALRALHVPRLFVSVLMMSYRYIALLLLTAGEMFVARRSRTVGRISNAQGRRSVGSGIGALFGKTVALSEEVHSAMISRGYNGDLRTLTLLRWRAADTAWTAAVLLIAFLALGGDQWRLF